MKKQHSLHQHPLTLQSHRCQCLDVLPVTSQQLASSTLVSHASLNLMFNVVWSQKSLPMKVISTNSSSPTQALTRIAIVVVMKEI